MIPAAASAVIMTVDPLGDGETGAIEVTHGPCEAIVAGVTSPDEAVFSRRGGTISWTVVGSKEHRIEYEEFGAEPNNARLLPNVLERGALAVSYETLSTLIRLGHHIESVFGVPQDIELVITPSGRIVVTQARPVTTLPCGIAPFTILHAA
jgi:pyruvate,water dikinase